MMSNFIVPDWLAPKRVRTLVTTRRGGVSGAPWTSFNLGEHVGDEPLMVAENRRRLREHLPGEPKWLKQVHGNHCVDAALVSVPPDADASFTRQSSIVCAVQTADCLPVFFCDDQASVVAVAHAGWRGLAAGILESTVQSMSVDPARLLAWLGPAIGPNKFEVGNEVRAAFMTHDAHASSAFVPTADEKWLADIYTLARMRIAAIGIRRITGTNWCTVTQGEDFFSYRRDGVTGRMASCIWLE
jgi:YfiH family protein